MVESRVLGWGKEKDKGKEKGRGGSEVRVITSHNQKKDNFGDAIGRYIPLIFIFLSIILNNLK
jgi:hypothetical protein